MFKEFIDAANTVKATKVDGERQRQEIQFQATERQKAIIAHHHEEMQKAKIQHAKRMLKIKEIQELLSDGPVTADTVDQLAKLCKQLKLD